MTRGKKIAIWALVALILIGALVAVFAVLFSNGESDNTLDTAKSTSDSTVTTKDLHITAFETVEGGYMAIYEDGSSSFIPYNKPEPPAEEKKVVTLTKGNDSIIVSYSDGSTSLLQVSSGNTPSIMDGSYVTKITDSGDGKIGVKYSNGITYSIDKGMVNPAKLYISEVLQTSDGIEISYSDGSSGKISSLGDISVSLNDLYNAYNDHYKSAISLDAFLGLFLNVETTIVENTHKTAAELLQSAIRIYTEFAVAPAGSSPSVSVSSGSGVIWRIDNDYTYIVTNYHVVYNMDAYFPYNNNSSIARKIYASVYGNEGYVVNTGRTDANLLKIYEYPNSFLCEFVGGSSTVDLAVIRVQNSVINGYSANTKAITCASKYLVGETAIAVGNPLGLGISVTKGVVSVESQYVTMQIVPTPSEYRVMRIDTSIYAGSSGGGLYNADGELIGITNGGEGDSGQNINYAIPIQIVKGVVNQIIRHKLDSDARTDGLYTINIGAELISKNMRCVYDTKTGYTEIVEDIEIGTVTSTSNTLCGLLNIPAGAKIESIKIDGITYEVKRAFDLTEALYNVSSGSDISVKWKSGANTQEKSSSDLAFGVLAKVN